MKTYSLRIPFDKTVTTSYGIPVDLQPAAQLLGDKNFAGILSTITIRLEGVDPTTTYLTARLTEDEEGDLCTMPDRDCSFTRGLTTNTKTTSIFKYEAQFHDKYPMHLFVKINDGTADLKEVILNYRS